MSELILPYLSPEAYLERERKAETKSEYECGHIVRMAGASPRHNKLLANLMGMLYNALRHGPCQHYAADLRVGIQQGRRYYYPDVVVVCDPPQYHDTKKDILINPLVVIEILSDSTEARDRGTKLRAYQRIPSLQEYVLAAQDRPIIERYRRAGEKWDYTLTTGLENVLTLESLGVILALADIYERVEDLKLDDDFPDDCFFDAEDM